MQAKFFYNILGVKVISDLRIFPELFIQKESFDNPDIVIMKKNIHLNKQKYNNFSVKFYFLPKKEFAFDSSFWFYKLKILVKNLIGTPTEVYYTCEEKKFYNIRKIIRQILLFKLVQKGIFLMHCGAGSWDDFGILVFAPSDTGKTSTILSLAREYNMSIIGDDMCLLKNLFVYRYTDRVSIYPKEEFFEKLHKKNKIILLSFFAKKVISFFPYFSLKIHPNIKLPMDYCGKVAQHAQIRKIFILKKGKKIDVDFENEDIINEILSINGEFLIPKGFGLTFWERLCYAFNINPFLVGDLYKQYLRNIIKDVSYEIIYGNSYKEFSKCIYERVKKETKK